MRQIILDTETTGLSAQNGDRLIEFAGVEMIDRRLTGNNLHLFVDPERDIPEGAIAIHGITPERLKKENAQVFAAVAQQIAEYISGAELVIHNASFDVGFLDMEFTRLGMPIVDQITSKVTDTLQMARERYPGQKNSLDALCTRLEVDRSKRVLHGALIDCELLAEVYLAMTRSQFSLVDELVTSNGNSQKPELANYQRRNHEALAVIAPTPTELAEHEAYLAALDKVVSGQCLWRSWEHEGKDLPI